jgi:hypothetical protein
MDVADGNFSLRSRRSLAPHRNALGLLIKTQNRQKNHMFEFAEVVAATLVIQYRINERGSSAKKEARISRFGELLDTATGGEHRHWAGQ